MPLEFALGSILLKALEIGLAAVDTKQKWAWTASDISAVSKLFDDGKDLVGLFSSAASVPADLVGKHALIATQAFGAACLAHWGGNEGMAPFAAKRTFRGLLGRTVRQHDWEQRVALASQRIGEPSSDGEPVAAIELLHAIVENPVTSPVYKALWWAFTSEALNDEALPRPLLFTRPGSKLEFERAFRTEYAEGVAAIPGFSSAALALASDAPRLLREIIVRWVSTWGTMHVFGPEARGLPSMPLEEIYVEPRAVHVDPKTGKHTEGLLRGLIKQHLDTSKIVIVRGDFGHGKSLTAKMLALDWAREFIERLDGSSAEVAYPVFIRCGDDMLGHTGAPTAVIRRALQRHARDAGCDRPLEDAVHTAPSASEAVRYLFDGLDEVALGGAEVEAMVADLHRMLGEQQQAVVFSRRGVVPSLEKLPKGTALLDIQPFALGKGGEVCEWLTRWNALSGRPAIEEASLHSLRLAELAQTPILLFMIAMTADFDNLRVTSRADLYERFLFQVARGKSEHDSQTHSPVVDASEALLSRLKQQNLAARCDGEDVHTSRGQAMLWLISRIAWEARRRSVLGKRITAHDLSTILRDELGLDDMSSRAFDLVKVGVLLALQADQHGRNHEILFGHKSFQEFLVARYWDVTLSRVVHERRAKERDAIISQLLGAPLLKRDDESFDFLLQLLGQWQDPDLRELIRFCEEEANSEAPRPTSKVDTWRNDESPWFRLGVLAIGSRLLWDARKGDAPGSGLHLESAFGICTAVRGLELSARSAFLIAPGVRIDGPVGLHGIIADELDLRGAVVSSLQLGHATVVPHLQVGSVVQGARLSGAVLSKLTIAAADMIATDLSKADLQLANLLEADLRGSNLEGAILWGAWLGRANLQQAILRKAVLASADLQKANLTWADLTDADLSNANLAHTDLSLATLVDANLSDAQLPAATLLKANLAGADLTGANLTGTLLHGADLRGAKVNASQLACGNLDHTTELSPELRSEFDALVASEQERTRSGAPLRLPD